MTTPDDSDVNYQLTFDGLLNATAAYQAKFTSPGEFRTFLHYWVQRTGNVELDNLARAIAMFDDWEQGND